MSNNDETGRRPLRTLAVSFGRPELNDVATMVGREPGHVREMLQRGADRVPLDVLEDLDEEGVIEALICAGDDGDEWEDDEAH